MNLSFLSKLAFICNLCLLVTWSMKYKTLIPEGGIQSTIIIAGLALSFLFNLVANFLYALLLFRGRPLSDYVPIWLAVINFLFLILQFYLALA